MNDKSTLRMEVNSSANGNTNKSSSEGVEQRPINGNSLHLQNSLTSGNTGQVPRNPIPPIKSTSTNQPELSKLIPNQTPNQMQLQAQNNYNSTKPKGKHSVVPSKHQNIRQHPLHIAPKYAKIQPAIAPKPSSSVPLTTKFNPIPSNKFQILMKSSLTQDATNLNTSKKWILPPRPRPGRKRTGTECDKVTKSQTNGTKRKNKPKLEANGKNGDLKGKIEHGTEGKSSTTVATTTMPIIKKEFDTAPTTTGLLGSNKQEIDESREPAASDTMRPSINTIKREERVMSVAATKTAVEPEVKLTAQKTNGANSGLQPNTMLKQLLPAPPPLPSTKSEDPKVQMTELKMSYLSKLKEQEIIRNYVEVLTNQIKELSFVQNGVITFDALKNTTKVASNSQRITSTLTKSKCDQLDSINNLNDLNKFLTYLSKSSDIIKSAKRQPDEYTSTSDNLNQQIDNYVQLRNRFKMLNQENGKKANKKKMGKSQPDSLESTKPKASSSTSVTTPKHTSPKSPFTPDLLRPLNASNLFNDPNLDMMEMDLQTETIEASPSTVGILADSDRIKATGDSLTIDFEATKFGVGNDASNDGEFFHVDEHDFLSKLVLDDTTPTEETEMGEVVIHKHDEEKNEPAINEPARQSEENGTEITKRNPITNDIIMKKKVKFNCGFCTNDTPCLCFDSDLEISRLD